MWCGKGDERLVVKRVRRSETANPVTKDPDLPYIYKMLPYEIREKITTVSDNYIAADPVNRSSIRYILINGLAVLANAVYKKDLNYKRFIDKKFSDSNLRFVCRSYSNTVPESGFYLGETVAQFFQHCKQQMNLNVKCKVGENMTDDQITNKTLEKKFEIIMSFKNNSEVECIFMCEPADYNCMASRLQGICNSRFSSANNVRCPILYERGEYSIFFGLKVYKPTNADIEYLFQEIQSRHCETCSVSHSNVLVYTSYIQYFLPVSRKAFIDNCLTYFYCVLTDRYKPVIETREDSFVFGLVKILANAEYFTESSLKRTQCSRVGQGPLITVISEGGLNETNKYVKNLISQGFVSSPASSSTEHMYVVNEPYINTFINRPVECGNFY